MDDLEIEPPDGKPPRRNGLQPWYSRLLYALYALATGAAGVAAYLHGMKELAIGAGVIGAVLLWKAAQRVQ